MNRIMHTNVNSFHLSETNGNESSTPTPADYEKIILDIAVIKETIKTKN